MTIRADEGYRLYNGTVIATEVSLGINDSKLNWRQITIEEAERIEAEEKARMLREMEELA